jgi:hypothetical protein
MLKIQIMDLSSTLKTDFKKGRAELAMPKFKAPMNNPRERTRRTLMFILSVCIYNN